MATKRWLRALAAKHQFTTLRISFSFCTDDTILALNRQFLKHDYYTDILTFPVECRTHHCLAGEIFISIDTVRSNALRFRSSFQHELLRVMSHGLLHLAGFNDKTTTERKKMRSAEEDAILLYNSFC